MLRTALFVFLAAAAGVILFTTIQDDIPDEISFLKNSGKYDAANLKDALGAPLPSKSVQSYKGWGVYADDERVVLVTKLTSLTTPAPEQSRAIAHLYVECSSRGQEVRMILVDGKSYPKTQPSVQVMWGQTYVSQWKLESGRIISTQPAYLSAALSANPMPFSIQASDSTIEAFSLSTEALPELTANLPPPCQL